LTLPPIRLDRGQWQMSTITLGAVGGSSRNAIAASDRAARLSMPSSSGLSARSESSPMCWGERVDERLPDNGPVPTRAGRYGDVRRHRTRQGSWGRLRGLSCQLPGPVQQVIRGNDLAHQRDTQCVFRREAACLTQRDHPRGVGKPDAATRPARALPPVRSSRACRRSWRSSGTVQDPQVSSPDETAQPA
jgi:hypothetical protein